jgi:hypothetical protein
MVIPTDIAWNRGRTLKYAWAVSCQAFRWRDMAGSCQFPRTLKCLLRQDGYHRWLKEAKEWIFDLVEVVSSMSRALARLGQNDSPPERSVGGQCWHCYCDLTSIHCLPLLSHLGPRIMGARILSRSDNHLQQHDMPLIGCERGVKEPAAHYLYHFADVSSDIHT